MSQQTVTTGVPGQHLDAALQKCLGFPVSSYKVHSVESLINAKVCGSTGGVWRLRGTAEARDGARPWSLIEKHIVNGEDVRPAWRAGRNAADPYYWRREAMIYDKPEVIGDLGSALRMPRAYGRLSGPRWSAAVFMEEVQGRPGKTFTAPQFVQAARALGEFQGGTGKENAARAPRWLTRRWLESFVDRQSQRTELSASSEAWNAPLLARYDQALRNGLARTERNAKQMARGLSRVTQTVVHNDVWAENLAIVPENGTSKVVLLDWAFAGVGALGQDAGIMSMHALMHAFVRPQDPRNFIESVFEGYADGLRAADPANAALIDEARFGFMAGMTARFFVIAEDSLRLAQSPHSPDSVKLAGQWETRGLPTLEEGHAHRANVSKVLVQCADEAAIRSAMLVPQQRAASLLER